MTLSALTLLPFSDVAIAIDVPFVEFRGTRARGATYERHEKTTRTFFPRQTAWESKTSASTQTEGPS